MKEVKAVNDKVIIEVMKKENKTESGLIIPESAAPQEPQVFGMVLSIGENVSKEIEVGDMLICHRTGGMDILMEGRVMKVLKDDEVYAVIKNNE